MNPRVPFCEVCHAQWCAGRTGERWTVNSERHQIYGCQSCGTRYVLILSSEPDGGTWVTTRDVIVLGITGTEGL